MNTVIVGMVGTLIGMVLMLIVFAAIKAMKAASKEEEVTPVAPMPADEREFILKEFSGTNVPFMVSDDVMGETSRLAVNWVEAYGVRYADIPTALSCKSLTKKEITTLKDLDANLLELRSVNMNTKRHLQVKDMLDGKVYVYEPCKIKLDVDKLPARIALEIVRSEDLSTRISSIYVSKLDVTSTKDRYEFDMGNPDDQESFKLLVREDKEYAAEMKELMAIEERLNHYNSLVAKDRIGQEEDGSIIVFPPTPEEIKALRQQAEPKKEVKEPLKTAQDIKAAIEEFVSSSSL